MSDISCNEIYCVPRPPGEVTLGGTGFGDCAGQETSERLMARENS